MYDTKSRSGWSKFRELVPLLVVRVLPFGLNSKLYFACGRNIILYGSENLLKRRYV